VTVERVRAEVEEKAALLLGSGTPAYLLPFLQKRDTVACAAQERRGGKPGKAATDYQYI
jgi:hypothetical protein